MARIKRTSASEKFNDLQSKSLQIGERNDCTVKAIALICDVTYDEAHAALKAGGRKEGQGCYWPAQEKALGILGFKVVKHELRTAIRKNIIAKYPSPHNTLQSATTHHPVRFKKVWAEIGDCLLYVRGHVAAYKDGRVHDWTEGRAKRVLQMVYVEKK